MTLRGSTSEFPLESVVGLLAGTSKTGELQIRGGGKVGALGFAGGRLVAAVMDNEGGEAALGAIFAVSEAEFEFTPWASAPEANLEAGDLVALLKRAADARDRLAAIRSQIPDDRARFKLSEKAADSGAVTFTPDRWRALLAVNGERDVAAVAEHLRLGKMETLSLLAGLVKDNVVEIIAPRAAAEPPPAPAEARHAAPAPEPAPPPAPPVEAASPPPEPLVVQPPPEPEWHATEPVREWTRSAPEERRAEPRPAPQTEVRPDLQAELAERFMERPPREEIPPPPPPAEHVPPAVDDRLASLTGIFAPGPAANAPPPPPPPPASTSEAAPPSADAWGAPQPPSSPSSTASWMTPSPASTEAPANAWAPTAPPETAEAEPWSTGPAAPGSQAAPARSRAAEWTAPAPVEAPGEKKRGGFLSRFRKDEPAAAVTRMPAASVASTGGLLASLSNALLVEYGSYGKGKIETRMANLLMRVDEQADPIDRPLPIVDDLIDATALEREGFAEQQSVPYLATLVRQIYEDAERAFGKDKAKKGYKAAQQQVFGNGNALSPDLAGKLPRV
ncbi:MAG TPA: DUF4388 domain-containing protein [Candidatus Limnocylindria bacterium]|nr:DUF4388 domain-containing protein [Candidatus Limnocylindria bacterium]